MGLASSWAASIPAVVWARPGGCRCRLRPLIFVGIASLIGVAYLNVLELTMDLVDPSIGPRR